MNKKCEVVIQGVHIRYVAMHWFYHQGGDGSNTNSDQVIVLTYDYCPLYLGTVL